MCPDVTCWWITSLSQVKHKVSLVITWKQKMQISEEQNSREMSELRVPIANPFKPGWVHQKNYAKKSFHDLRTKSGECANFWIRETVDSGPKWILLGFESMHIWDYWSDRPQNFFCLVFIHKKMGFKRIFDLSSDEWDLARVLLLANVTEIRMLHQIFATRQMWSSEHPKHYSGVFPRLNGNKA